MKSKSKNKNKVKIKNKIEMKYILNATRYIAIAATILFLISCQSSRYGYKTEKDADEIIFIGTVGRDLFTKPETLWFDEAYDSYIADIGALQPLRGWNDSLDVIIFLGTWCSDTHRELPRFLKIVESTHPPIRIVEFHALDRNKKSDSDLPEKYNITNVPTFVFLKNGKEIGRIVEKPQNSLEEDIVEIFQKSK